jgi:hypothetical protein
VGYLVVLIVLRNVLLVPIANVMIAEKNMGVTAARMARSLVLIAKGL